MEDVVWLLVVLLLVLFLTGNLKLNTGGLGAQGGQQMYPGEQQPLLQELGVSTGVFDNVVPTVSMLPPVRPPGNPPV